MFCTRCGTRIEDTARYCSSCGHPTKDEAPPHFTAAPIPVPGRRLRRVLTGKKIAGVCTGFAEYFDMDVALMRLIWVGLALVPPNIGVIGYVASWLVLPKEQA